MDRWNSLSAHFQAHGETVSKKKGSGRMIEQGIQHAPLTSVCMTQVHTPVHMSTYNTGTHTPRHTRTHTK